MAVIDATGEQPSAASRCWCCGTTAEPDRMVRLGNHPEVGVCLRCARYLAKQAREIEDRDRTGAVVELRDLFRRLRRAVVAHGWQNSRFVGRALRALGKHLP